VQARGGSETNRLNRSPNQTNGGLVCNHHQLLPHITNQYSDQVNAKISICIMFYETLFPYLLRLIAVFCIRDPGSESLVRWRAHSATIARVEKSGRILATRKAGKIVADAFATWQRRTRTTLVEQVYINAGHVVFLLFCFLSVWLCIDDLCFLHLKSGAFLGC
jgi:hypothetical protein